MPEGAGTPARAARSSVARRARERALGVLYEMWATGHAADEVLARRSPADDADEAEAEALSPSDPRVAERAATIVRGVVAQSEGIDERIAWAAPSFPLAQMPPIDLTILRVALHEILFDNGRVPVRLAISEAVELAKVFGSDSSPRFINGVLSTLAREAATEAEAEAQADATPAAAPRAARSRSEPRRPAGRREGGDGDGGGDGGCPPHSTEPVSG